MHVGAIIVAGGSGLRMGADVPKQFLRLCGVTILWRSMMAIADALPPNAPIVVTLPHGYAENRSLIMDVLPEYAEQAQFCFVVGGETRTQSVQNALFALNARMDAEGLVVIHDGVRPLVRRETILSVLQAAGESGAATTAVPVRASLRQKTVGGGSQSVRREDFMEVQTPQVFRLSLLLEAYTQVAKTGFTDDASLVEALTGTSITLVKGAYDNLKITTREDIYQAELLLQSI